MLLADANEIEFLRSLSQNWPLLALLASAIAWFAKCVAQPLTTRHIAWMDAMEERDKVRLESDIDHKHTLADVREKVVALNDKASTIKEIVSRHAAIQPQHGGG